MTLVVMIIVLIGAAVMQTLTPVFICMGQAKFPFLLGVVIYYAFNRDSWVVFLTAFLAGFLQDVLSPIPLGYSVFCFCIIAWITSCFSKMVITDSFVPYIFFGAVMGFVTTIFLYILLFRKGYIISSFKWCILKAFGTGITGMICVPIMFFITSKFDVLVGNVEIKERIDEIEWSG